MGWDTENKLQNELWEEFYFYKTANATIAESIAPGKPFRIREIILHFSNSIQSIEALRIYLSSMTHSYYNVIYLNHAMSGSTDIVWVPSASDGHGFESDEHLVISFSNSGGIYYGMTAKGWQVLA